MRQKVITHGWGFLWNVIASLFAAAILWLADVILKKQQLIGKNVGHVGDVVASWPSWLLLLAAFIAALIVSIAGGVMSQRKRAPQVQVGHASLPASMTIRKAGRIERLNAFLNRMLRSR